MAEQIATAVQAATQEMQKTLIDHLTNTLEQTSHRLEDRIARSRERQEGFMNILKGEQERFQEEIRSTMTSLKGTNSGQGHTGKSSSEYRMGKGGTGVGSGDGFGSGRPDISGVGSGRVGEFGSSRGFGDAGGNYHHGSSGGNWRFRKLDLPTFEGDNPDGWILRAERYFKFYRLTDDEQMEAAVVSLDGDALLWYQWEQGRRPIRCWEELKGMLLHQFRPTAAGTLYEQWLNHQQTTGVVEYRRKFIELMAPLAGVPEEIAKGQYITGLKEDVKAEVRLLGPRSLDHAMELSVKVEEKLRTRPHFNVNSKHLGSSGSSYSSNSNSLSFKSEAGSFSPSVKSSSTYSFNSTSPTATNVRNQGSYPIAKPLGEVKKLSEKELRSKREKGECFRCDEKWSVGHRCKKKRAESDFDARGRGGMR